MLFRFWYNKINAAPHAKTLWRNINELGIKPRPDSDSDIELAASSFPNSWKLTKIIPNTKVSSPSLVGDLRPITILLFYQPCQNVLKG